MKLPTQHAEVAMKVGGVYALGALGTKHVIDEATPLVCAAIDAMELPPDRFSFCDMGCADGGTSVEMIGAAIETIRKRAPHLPVLVVHADQPLNDYNALMDVVHDLTEVASFLPRFEGVYPLASATTFFRQILPPASLHLGFSANAMHWLSTKPGNISNHLQPVGAEGAELEAYREQARRDWETLLRHRAAELVPGGHLVLAPFSHDEQGQYLGNTVGVNLFDNLNGIWQRFVDEGVITAEEYLHMNHVQYYKTVEEWREPFDDAGGPVWRSGLRLRSIENRVVPCPFAARFKQHRDVERFVGEYIPGIRYWSESIYAGALSSRRSVEERGEIIEHYYQTYAERVRSSPDDHQMDHVNAYIVIEKH